MNIFIIMWKEITQNFRDKKAMGMMVLFPIILILILGMALSKVMDSDEQKSIDAKVLYTRGSNTQLNDTFNAFKDVMGKELKINFEESKDINKGIESMKDYKYTCYVNITDKDIKIYKNDRYQFNANLVENILNTFVNRGIAISQIAKENPKAIQEIIKNTKADYTKAVSLDKKKQPRAKDYYAVTMITLMIFYGSATGVYSILSEKRLLAAPVKKYEIFIGKTLGAVTITAFQIIIVVLFSKFLLNTYWGEHIWIVLLILLTAICVSISFGIGLTLLLGDESKSSGILNVLIPVMAFLGGNYFAVENVGSTVLDSLAKISPLRWTNQCIFKIIYGNDFSLVGSTLAINIGLVLIFLLMASLKYRKEGVV